MDIQENQGIIYKITNNLNGKIYIGKTKEFYGKKKIQNAGINRRFIGHVSEANSNKKNKCHRLGNALKKYGKENFIIEEILKCNLEDVDKHEIEQIKKHNSTDRNIGYNILLGGNGGSRMNADIVSQETREKISKAHATNDEEMNIKKFFKNGIHTGYKVSRRQNAKIFRKYFTSCKSTPEANYNLAKNWLDSLVNGTLTNKIYNKETDLPKNISYEKRNNQVIGYRVSYYKDKKRYQKVYSDSTYSLEENFQKAIEFKKQLGLKFN